MKYDLTKIGQSLLLKGGFGLERETLRVTADGRLAQSLHPFGDDPALSRDFCENQLEIITSVSATPEEVVNELARLHRTASAVLREKNELLWPFSNPPYFGTEDEIPIAQFDGTLKNKQLYRQYLARKYGKKKMLFSGIHLNFSFSKELTEALTEQAGTNSDRLYLTLAERLVQYSWLIVLTTAASSVAEESFIESISDYSSPRCSAIGYWNTFTPVLDHASLYSYCESIQELVNDGSLVSASELYYPIRLKPRGENSLEALLDSGIDHIELRMYDLDPLAPYGIFPEDVGFAQLLMLYLLSLELPSPGAKEQKAAIDKMKQAAMFSGKEAFKEEAESVLNDMEKYFAGLGFGKDKLSLISFQKKKLLPGQSYSERVRQLYGEDFTAKGTVLAASRSVE